MCKIDTITVSQRHYDELLNAKAILKALNAAGVDNWEGYSYAMEIYNEDN